MRPKKWMVFVLAFVIIAYLVAYFLVRKVGLGNIIKTNLQTYVTTKFQLDTQIGELSFNDKQINFSQVLVKQNGYTAEIDELFVEYNLYKLLTYRFKKKRFISSIKIYNPTIKIKSLPEKEKNSLDINTVLDFVGEVEIINGTLHFTISNKNIYLTDSIANLQVSLSAKNDTTKAVLSGFVSDTYPIKTTLQMDSVGILQAFDFNLQDYNPQNLKLKRVDSMDIVVENTINYKRGQKVALTTKLKEVFIKKDKNSLIADSILLFGNVDSVNLATYQMKIDGIPIKVDVEAQNILKPKFSFVSNINYDDKYEIEDILMEVDRKTMEFKLVQATWADNLLWGEVKLLDDVVEFLFGSENFVYTQNINKTDYTIASDFVAIGSVKNGIVDGFLDLDSVYVLSEAIELSNFSASGEFAGGNVFSFRARDSTGSTQLNGELDIKTKNVEFTLVASSFHPEDYLTKKIGLNLPRVSVETSGILSENSLSVLSDIELIPDSFFTIVDGSLSLGFDIELQQGGIDLQANSKKLFFRGIPISFILQAEGNREIISTNVFEINNQISADVIAKPSEKWGFEVKANGSNIDIKEYSKYFLNNFVTANIGGRGDFLLDFSTNGNKSTKLEIQVEDFSFVDFGYLDLNFVFGGELDQKILISGEVEADNNPIAMVGGDFVWNESFGRSIKMDAEIKKNKIENILINNNGNLKGELSGVASFSYDSLPNFLVEVSGTDFSIEDFDILQYTINLKQNDRFLVLDEFSVAAHPDHTLYVSGQLGFNVLTGEKTISDSTIVGYYQGDILNLLSSIYSFSTKEASNARLFLKVGMREDGLTFENGGFILENGEVFFKTQQEQIEKLNVAILVENDSILIKEFSAKMGKGIFTVSNRIFGDEFDLKFGQQKLGRVFVETPDRGIALHYPGFMVEKSTAEVKMEGGDGGRFEIRGPVGNMQIQGDLLISKGRGLYPKYSENLFAILRNENQRKKLILPVFPVEVDLRLIMDENNYYSTYPLNLAIDQGGFLALSYKEGIWSIPEASFSSDGGTIEVFSTIFKAKTVDVNISKTQNIAKVYGEFEKYAFDGSTVTYSIFNQDETNLDILDNLKTELKSSNTNLKSDLEIIYSFRQYSSATGVEPAQMYALVQDQAVFLLGSTFQEAIFKPFISPLEQSMSRLFNLDYFIVRFWFFQNIFNQYSQLNTSQEVEKREKTISSFFLNNMNLLIGRGVARNLFFETEIYFQEPVDFSDKREILMYQDFGLRYNLPANFKLNYKFKALNPFSRQSHEIFIGKSVAF